MNVILKPLLLPYKLFKKYRLKRKLKKRLINLLDYYLNPKEYKPGDFSIRYSFNVNLIIKTINKIDKL